MYCEKEISKDAFPKLIDKLDLDEGIRIENKGDLIFLNKTANRYCINISKKNKDEFFYHNNSDEVINFLNERMDPDCKIFSY